MTDELDAISKVANERPLEASLLLVEYYANLSGTSRADQMAENAWVLEQGADVWRKTLNRFQKVLEQERDKRASVNPQA